MTLPSAQAHLRVLAWALGEGSREWPGEQGQERAVSKLQRVRGEMGVLGA